MSSDLGNIASSVAATASTSSATAGTSGAPTTTSTTPAATTPEVTPVTVLRAEVSSALAAAADGLVQASLELIGTLGEVPTLQGAFDGDSGTDRQQFLATRSAWDSLMDAVEIMQVLNAPP